MALGQFDLRSAVFFHFLDKFPADAAYHALFLVIAAAQRNNKTGGRRAAQEREFFDQSGFFALTSAGHSRRPAGSAAAAYDGVVGCDHRNFFLHTNGVHCFFLRLS